MNKGCVLLRHVLYHEDCVSTSSIRLQQEKQPERWADVIKANAIECEAASSVQRDGAVSDASEQARTVPVADGPGGELVGQPQGRAAAPKPKPSQAGATIADLGLGPVGRRGGRK